MNGIAAAIDVGTNSVKVLVGRRKGRQVEVLHERVAVTRLGEGLDRSSRLSDAAVRRTMRMLRSFRLLAEAAGATTIAAVGTLALRRASNGREVLRRIEEESGVRIRVAGPREEARLAYRAACGISARGRRVVVDLGGGSMQVSTGVDGGLGRSWSLPLGAVVVTERFVTRDPVPPADQDRIRAHADVHLARLGRLRAGELTGVGGAVGVLSGILGGGPVEVGRLQRLADDLAALPVRARERRGVPRGRSDIIVAGAIVLLALMRRLGASRLRPSPFGLRHGLLARALGL